MRALITGGTAGIGLEMARNLLMKGYDVILVSRHENETETLRAAFPDREITFMSADLSEENECFRILDETEQYGDIEVFIANAGIGDVGRFQKTSVEKEIRMVKLNDISTLILTKGFMKRFVEKDKGRIIVTCSAASFGVAGYMNVYYATKSFAYSLVQGYHRELKDMKSKVTISALCPGPVKTNFEKEANTKFNIKTMSAEKVGKTAINKGLKGKLVIVPGFTMKCLHFASHLVPKRLISKILNKQAQIKE